MAELLGVSTAGGLGLRHRVRLAIVLNHIRVVDGDVVHAVLEVVNRVSAVAHDLDHQVVGALDGLRGLVDEPVLDVRPLLAIPHGIRCKASGVASRAGNDVDATVDDRLDRLYGAVRERLVGDSRAERTLTDLKTQPDDARQQGRLEEVIEKDPEFATRVAAMLDDLSQYPPVGGIAARDTGPVAGGNVVITGGRDAAGRDLTYTDPRQGHRFRPLRMSP